MKIPSHLKKVKEVNWTKEQLEKFELDCKKEWETGEVLGPVHLSKGNEEQLIEIFQYVKSSVLGSVLVLDYPQSFEPPGSLDLLIHRLPMGFYDPHDIESDRTVLIFQWVSLLGSTNSD